MGIFKAYDVRGIVPAELNAETAYRIGFGFAKLLSEDADNPLIVVGVDARPTGPWLAAWLCDGILAGGGRPEFIGPSTSPMLYWAVAGRSGEFSGGAMITASHNPARYNGVKFCREKAIPISLETGMRDIEAAMPQAPAPGSQPSYMPRVTLFDGARMRMPESVTPLGLDPMLYQGYMQHVRRFAKRMPEHLKLALDTANGMGGIYLPLLRSLGLNVVAINSECDGTFPNHEANPSKLDNLRPLVDLVRREKCALGVAIDGDGDRAVFVDEVGAPVGQDMITALLAREFLSREKGALVLYDLRSSRAVAEIVEEAGGRAIRERVGHSFMKATMRKVGCVFGGELAGHYYFRDSFYADSAIITVIEVLNAMGLRDETLSNLIKPLRRYFQSGEVNFKLDKAAAFKAVKERYADGRIDELDGVTVQYDDWWFNLRGSNTEPLVRLNLEASSREQLGEKFAELRKILGDPAE
ncbi:MAG: Phosphomannomutase/phosphoglucomutase [Planctomycetes bacterium]|nr:Phosphomannomutase/phosphoglucomutase [Planctomycetota bacterium]